MAANRAVIPPITALRAAGCPIAMGTDNNTQDMLEVMRMGLVTERILRDDSTQPQPEDVLWETTRGGAYALRKQDEIGSLEVGKKADLIVVNTQRAHLAPTMRIVSSWIHNGQGGDIESVMVNGAFLMRDHQVLTIDEQALVKQADEIGRRAWHQLLEQYPSAPFPTRVAPRCRGISQWGPLATSVSAPPPSHGKAKRPRGYSNNAFCTILSQSRLWSKSMRR